MASPYAVQRIYEFGKKYDIETNFRFLEGPNWLDIRNFPTGAKKKKEIIKNLELFKMIKKIYKMGKSRNKIIRKVYGP